MRISLSVSIAVSESNLNTLGFPIFILQKRTVRGVDYFFFRGAEVRRFRLLHLQRPYRLHIPIGIVCLSRYTFRAVASLTWHGVVMWQRVAI